jgi:hypothetical protein
MFVVAAPEQLIEVWVQCRVLHVCKSGIILVLGGLVVVLLVAVRLSLYEHQSAR